MADFKIFDKVNNANPAGTSGILIDIGSGYNHITVDQLKELYTAAINGQITTIQTDIEGLQQNKADTDHVHPNANATDAGFLSPALYTKLEGLDNNFKGRYTTESGLTTAHPSAESGNWAFVNDGTPSVYVWDAGLATPAWVDTGSTSSGDMLRSTYDPNSYGVPAYPRANHTGEQAIATITGLQTALDNKEAKFTKNTAFNKNFGTTAGTVAEGSALAGKSDTGHIHPNSTQLADGFNSKENQIKLDGIEANATNVIVDSAFSATSANPVQNKLVKAELDKKVISVKGLIVNNTDPKNPVIDALFHKDKAYSDSNSTSDYSVVSTGPKAETATLTNGSSTISAGSGVDFLAGELSYSGSAWFWVKVGTEFYCIKVNSSTATSTSLTILEVRALTDIMNYNRQDAYWTATTSPSVWNHATGSYQFYRFRNFSLDKFGISIGNNSLSSAFGISIGGYNSGNSPAGIGIGFNNISKGEGYNVALGAYNTVTNYGAVALGYLNYALARFTTVTGYRNKAEGEGSAIIGGQDSIIPATSPRSSVIGGNAITVPANTPDTAFAQNLNVGGGKTSTNLLKFWNNIGTSVLNWSPTVARTIEFPDKDGTVALLTDISASGGKIRHDTYTALTLSGTMSWDVMNVAEGKAKITIPSGTAVTDIAFSLANAADGFTGILAVYNNDTVSHNLNLPTAGIYAVSDGESASNTIVAGAITEFNFAHDGIKIKVTKGGFVAI